MCFIQILAGSFLLGSWITTFYLTGEYDISPSLLRKGSEQKSLIKKHYFLQFKRLFSNIDVKMGTKSF
jgi:hypothetical protein